MAATKEKPHLCEDVANLVTRVERIEKYNAPAVMNMHENWRYYWGLYPQLGQGQWPASSIPKMIQSGRQLTQYNFILPIIDSLLAIILKIPMEPEFIPLDNTSKQLTEIAKHMIYSDRELMNWSVAERKFALYGLISEGVMKMEVSNKYSDLGNISLVNCPQGSVFFDPFWKTGLRQDLKRAYKKFWISAEEAHKTYGIERAYMEAQLNKIHGEEYGTFLGINPYDMGSNMWGSMHQGYEEYFMMPVDHTVEMIVGPEGEAEMPDIPDKDKPDYLDAFFPGWDKTSVYADTFKVEECFLRTALPTLLGDRLVVDKRRTEVQIGSPPFFRWAANMENGQCRGMVDSLKDPQTNQNFIESEILRKIQTEGGGGSKFVDESLFMPGESKKFRMYSNRPDMKFLVKPGTLRKGLTPSTPVETTGVPQALYSNIQHIQRDIIPNVSKRPPVAMGQVEEGNQTSGRLFRLMGAEADNQIESMVVSLRDCKNDIYEAYLIQAGQTYSNEMLPREFMHKGKVAIANEPVELSRGVVLKNDVRGLLRMRHKVIISEKQASPSAKANTANQLLTFMKAVPPENIGTRTVINHEVIKNIEQVDEKTQAELEEMAALEKDLAKSKLKLEKANIEMQLVQIEMQMQQMQPPTAPPQGDLPGPQKPAQPSYELPQRENGEMGSPADEAAAIDQEMLVPEPGAESINERIPA